MVDLLVEEHDALRTVHMSASISTHTAQPSPAATSPGPASTGVATVLVGPVAKSLRPLQESAKGPFDLVFLDADEPSNPAYLTAALELTCPGSVIIADKIISDGTVVDPTAPTTGSSACSRSRTCLTATPGSPPRDPSCRVERSGRLHDRPGPVSTTRALLEV